MWNYLFIPLIQGHGGSWSLIDRVTLCDHLSTVSFSWPKAKALWLPGLCPISRVKVRAGACSEQAWVLMYSHGPWSAWGFYLSMGRDINQRPWEKLWKFGNLVINTPTLLSCTQHPRNVYHVYRHMHTQKHPRVLTNYSHLLLHNNITRSRA